MGRIAISGSVVACQCRQGLQPRAGERSEAGGRTRSIWASLLLRTITPPSPFQPREVANLACFSAAIFHSR